MIYTQEEKLRDVFRKNAETLLPPDIPLDVSLNLYNVRVFEKDGEIKAFINSIEFPYGKEIEFAYSKRNDFEGNLFLLEEINKLTESGDVYYTVWEHNENMMKIARKISTLMLKGYVWTVSNPDIEFNKNLVPFVVSYGKGEDLVFNGSYLSMYFNLGNLDYSFVNRMMEKYRIPYFVIYYPAPDLRFKYYRFSFFRVIPERIKAYIKMYRKVMK